MLKISRLWHLLTVVAMFQMVLRVSSQDGDRGTKTERKAKKLQKLQKKMEDYSMDKRIQWAERWFLETDLFPKTILNADEQIWWDSLGFYTAPGISTGNTDAAIQADLEKWMADLGSRKKRSADNSINRYKRQTDDINYENMTLEEISQLFSDTWGADPERFPATELTELQKLYFGGHGLKSLLNTVDGNEDQNRRDCHNVDLPAWQRVEWRRMGSRSRQSFIDALRKLASFYPGGNDAGSSGMDIFVKMHRFLNSPGAIRGASLLPINREYLFRFANALHRQGYRAELPYWDVILESELPDPSESMMWSEHNLGSVHGEVGRPFDFIKSIAACKKDETSSSLYRQAVERPMNQHLLFTREKLQTILSKHCYNNLTWLWDADFESAINDVHIFFGMIDDTQMADPNCALTDPTFWLFSAFVDLIWEEFRETQQEEATRETEYPRSRPGIIPTAMSWYSKMKPFGSRLNIHGLSNYYTTYFYSYEKRLSSIECKKDVDCDPESNGFVWCDTKSNECHAKIKEGGKCHKKLPKHQCYCASESHTPKCKKEKCTCT